MRSYYLGIDVSKGYADFVIINNKKQPIEENFQLDDTFDGHCNLYEKLIDFFKTHPSCILYAAVESTGGYENNWFNSLKQFQSSVNLKVARLNPFAVNASSKASLKRIKTDKISAQHIAEYLITHPENVTYEKNDPLASLRKQWVFIKMLTKQKTQLLNQLESLLYTANPEILIYCKGGTPEWALKLLIKYPTAYRLAKANSHYIARIPYITVDRATELINNAKGTIASSSDKITEQIIIATVKQILHLKTTIKSQTKIMARSCAIPEVNLLKTFNSMGDFSAIGLVLEIQCASRFSSVKKLSSFFGIHPVFKESGDGSSGFHMSKKGRKEPRRILFMVALSAIRSNPLIQTIYLEHIQKGMNKMAAIGVCMHKILRIIYGMLKNNMPFDPEINKKHRQKISQPKNHVCQDKNRRYQEYDLKAPVSRRQNRKRRERKQSHSDNITKSGSSSPLPFCD
jgi:transposase